jgi:hypothetical protein
MATGWDHVAYKKVSSLQSFTNMQSCCKRRWMRALASSRTRPGQSALWQMLVVKEAETMRRKPLVDKQKYISISLGDHDTQAHASTIAKR